MSVPENWPEAEYGPMPDGLDWRPDLVDRPELCPAYATGPQVHCMVPVDPETGTHAGQPHGGLGFPR